MTIISKPITPEEVVENEKATEDFGASFDQQLNRIRKAASEGDPDAMIALKKLHGVS